MSDGLLNEPYSLMVVADCGCLAGVSFEADPQGLAGFIGQWGEGYRVEVSTDAQHSARKCPDHEAVAS